jgi:hypothetical protein
MTVMVMMGMEMPVAVMMPVAAMAMFADGTFIQRKFIADADIEFAHSYSLQNAALLAAE